MNSGFGESAGRLEVPAQFIAVALDATHCKSECDFGCSATDVDIDIDQLSHELVEKDAARTA